MPSSDLRIVRGAALASAAVSAVVVVVATLLAGRLGLYGALLGSALAIAFFAVTIVAVSVAARVSPELMMIAALGTYLLKIVGILALLLTLRGSTAFDHTAFALATVIGACAFLGAELRLVLTARTPYVETGEGGG